jgi:predicted lipoprotein with Yx(FWY)xxD motif
MKNTWIYIVGAVVVVAVAYFGIKMYGSSYSGTNGATSAPSYTTSTPISTPETSGNVISTQAGAKGNYLVGANGMTLYTYDKDSKEVSNCTGSCAGVWPPYVTSVVPSSLPTNISTVTRSDGSIQFTYKGLPLYYYTGDTQSGDINGDGVGGIWHLVKP